MKIRDHDLRGDERDLAERFDIWPGQALFDGRDLGLPTGLCIGVLGMLVGRFGRVVPHYELHAVSSPVEACDELRGVIKTLRRALKAANVPCRIEVRRRCGYMLVAETRSATQGSR
ncbi:MAG: helix-turn-helix domain-containing protein [Lentisphaerae bacterium]|nr:helix-turn-helix domain-containing protein [Lentisphaerota bacterium]